MSPPSVSVTPSADGPRGTCQEQTGQRWGGTASDKQTNPGGEANARPCFPLLVLQIVTLSS